MKHDHVEGLAARLESFDRTREELHREARAVREASGAQVDTICEEAHRLKVVRETVGRHLALVDAIRCSTAGAKRTPRRRTDVAASFAFYPAACARECCTSLHPACCTSASTESFN